MLAEQVDRKLLSSLGKTQQPIEREHVRERSAPLAPGRHVEEPLGHALACTRAIGDGPVLGVDVVVVHLLVLLVQGAMEERPAQPARLEQERHECAASSVLVVELLGDWSTQL